MKSKTQHFTKNTMKHYYRIELRNPDKHGYIQIHETDHKLSHDEWGKLKRSKGLNTYGRGYASKDELIKNEFHTQKCKSCNGYIYTGYYTKKHLCTKELCFTCDFWLSKLDKDHLIIVRGQMYSDGGYKKANTRLERKMLGFGGRDFFVKKGDRIWHTNNMWTSGNIPGFFIDKFPDNASFISRVDYNELKNRTPANPNSRITSR